MDSEKTSCALKILCRKMAYGECPKCRGIFLVTFTLFFNALQRYNATVLKNERGKEEMSNFERFMKLVVARLYNRFHGEKEFRVESIPKNNGIMLKGLAAVKNGEAISPVVYLEDYFERYEEGVSMEMIVNELYDMFNTFEKPDFSVDILEDFESLKDKVFYKLVNYQMNQKVLKTIPHVRFLDLAVIFNAMAGQDEKGQYMARIENKHMKSWGTNVKTLYALAEKNTPRLFPRTLESMPEIMERVAREHLRKDYDEEFLEELFGDVRLNQKASPLYVLGNQCGTGGAAAMLYKGVLKDFADKVEKDLVILPSSIHEVLLIPYEEKLEMESLRDMVRGINKREVPESDVLSNSVYLYQRDSDSVILAP